MNKTKYPSWESHLVQRAVHGETVAFELLIDLYRPTLLSLAGRMLRNSDDAKDAVQETIVKAFRAIAQTLALSHLHQLLRGCC